MNDALAPMFGGAKGPWIRAFAWLPHHTPDGGTIWLRRCWKRHIHKHSWLDGGADRWWQYRRFPAPRNDAAPTSSYTVQRERFAEVAAEAAPLLARHWDEIAWAKQVSTLDPNDALYRAMDDAGALLIVTVRYLTELIGYAAYFVRNHHHAKGTKWAVSDVYWVAPEHRGRGAGRRLFMAVERECRAMGVQVLWTSGKNDHPEAERLLLAMGHTAVEWSVAKVLK